MNNPRPNNITNDLQFEELIKGFSPPEQFLARQIKELRVECRRRETCYPHLILSRKQIAGGVGVIGGSSAIVVAVIELILKLAGA